MANRGALQQSKARLTHPLPVRLASEVPPTSYLPCLLYLPVHTVTGRKLAGRIGAAACTPLPPPPGEPLPLPLPLTPFPLPLPFTASLSAVPSALATVSAGAGLGVASASADSCSGCTHGNHGCCRVGEAQRVLRTRAFGER